MPTPFSSCIYFHEQKVAAKLGVDVQFQSAVFFDLTPRPEAIDIPLRAAAEFLWPRIVQTLVEHKTKTIFLAFILMKRNLYLVCKEGPRDLKNEWFDIRQRQGDLVSRPRWIFPVRCNSHI